MSVSRRRLSPFAAISGTAASAAMPSRSLTGLMVHLPCPPGCTRGVVPSTVVVGRPRRMGNTPAGYHSSARTTNAGWRTPLGRRSGMKWRRLRRRPGGVIDRRGQAPSVGYGGRGLGGIPIPVGGGLGAVVLLVVVVFAFQLCAGGGFDVPGAPDLGRRRGATWRIRSERGWDASRVRGCGGRRHPDDVG